MRSPKIRKNFESYGKDIASRTEPWFEKWVSDELPWDYVERTPAEIENDRLAWPQNNDALVGENDEHRQQRLLDQDYQTLRNEYLDEGVRDDDITEIRNAIRDFRPELLKINNAARPIKFDDIIYQDKANLALRFPQALLLGNMRYLDNLLRTLLSNLGNFGVMDILHQGSDIPTSHLQFMEIILSIKRNEDDEDDDINVIDSATTDNGPSIAILVADRLNQPDHVGKIQSWHQAKLDEEACDLKGSGLYLGWEPRTDILKDLVQRCDKPEPLPVFKNDLPVYIGADDKLYFLTYDPMVTTEPTTLQ
ncbi:hypothetical protein IWQ60_006375 [Tieghemiomyces parasiticus]|uniref:Uncharacterized protein n=1 Tax=Tieghemiomyces parasiticus TaxID=78921 RepID=A0A9W8DXD8_9FUNG|nr:hypothetical protein IWQ60_006375 [Tieghemiomyces parasiticus]